jgi:hypothetical protein
MSDKEEVVNLMIDQRLEAYRSFFNHAWARQVIEATKGTKLDRLAFLLTVNLRGVVNCHALPWLMMNSMSNLWKGFLTDHELQGNFVNKLSVELPKRMEGRISRMRQREMGDMIRDIAQKVNEGLAQHDLDLSAEQLWQDYLRLENHEWIAAIWGSQRLVFCGIFFAYEGFVKDVVAIAKNDPNYKGYWNNLVTDTKQCFGDQVGIDCLEGDFIQVSQLARHALAHSSGKETTKLQSKAGHGLDVVDGLLQIQPLHNQTLCKAVEKRTLRLIQAAVALPAFQLKGATT